MNNYTAKVLKEDGEITQMQITHESLTEALRSILYLIAFTKDRVVEITEDGY